MGRYLGPRCRKCRYLGYSVCGKTYCALSRRETRPGMHPQPPRGAKEYKLQLVEKQKLRFSYWVSEQQLRSYMRKAIAKRGVTGETLLRLLEQRLDVVVFRVGFAPTLQAARQLVVHGHFQINGLKVTKPSYQVRPGEVVSIKEKSRKLAIVQDGLERRASRPELRYLEMNKEALHARLVSLPGIDEIPVDVDERLVVEYYTKYL